MVKYVRSNVGNTAVGAKGQGQSMVPCGMWPVRVDQDPLRRVPHTYDHRECVVLAGAWALAGTWLYNTKSKIL